MLTRHLPILMVDWGCSWSLQSQLSWSISIWLASPIDFMFHDPTRADSVPMPLRECDSMHEVRQWGCGCLLDKRVWVLVLTCALCEMSHRADLSLLSGHFYWAYHLLYSILRPLQVWLTLQSQTRTNFLWSISLQGKKWKNVSGILMNWTLAPEFCCLSLDSRFASFWLPVIEQQLVDSAPCCHFVLREVSFNFKWHTRISIKL